MWVSPFGNPRIEAYLQLPEAYRSLSRPSSAPDAKAFALCSFSLELPIYIVCSLNCLSFFVNKINFALKRFILFVSFSFSTFRWNCNFNYPFWKDSINFSILSSFICSFLTHFIQISLNFFFYSIVKFHLALLLCSFLQSLSHREMFFRLSLTPLELCLSGLPDWSVWMDSNHRPHAYQACALATWATDRFFLRLFSSSISQGFILDGGDEGIRTLDPLLAGQVLSQLSYTPILLGVLRLFWLKPDNWTTKFIGTREHTLSGLLS